MLTRGRGYSAPKKRADATYLNIASLESQGRGIITLQGIYVGARG